MVKRQRFQAQDVRCFNRKQLGAQCGDMPGQVPRGRFGKRQLAYLHFSDDLPEAGYAQKQIGRAKNLASLRRQATVVRDGPEEGVRIQQNS